VLPVLIVRLPHGASAPAVARRVAAPWLRGAGIPEAAAGNALLVISDLVTDAVLKGAPNIEVRAEVEGEALFIRVTSPPPLGAPVETSEGGVGLGMVGACCDVVDVRDDASGFRHVVCTIALR
jgi:hypothetical protein